MLMARYHRSTVVLSIVLLILFGTSSAIAKSKHRSAEEIKKRIDKYIKTEIQNIYNEYLKQGHTVSGTVSVRFAIAPSGKVTSCSIVKSTTGDRDFDEIIAATVAAWDFKPKRDSGTTKIVYPFTFACHPPAAGD